MPGPYISCLAKEELKSLECLPFISRQVMPLCIMFVQASTLLLHTTGNSTYNLQTGSGGKISNSILRPYRMNIYLFKRANISHSEQPSPKGRCVDLLMIAGSSSLCFNVVLKSSLS